jgi:hypothetical protein
VKLAAVLVWQLLHWIVPVGMCGGVVMPVAVAPLWQLEQLVSDAEWTKAAPDQVVVLAWQVEHSAVVATWPVPLPCAPEEPWLR